MPWKITNVMEQRIEFIVRAMVGGNRFSELCRHYGISRPTGYKWVKRYLEAGSFSQLVEQSKRPHNSPSKTPSVKEAEVIELRERYGWGGKKLNELLKRERINLSVRTINRIIKRNGLIKSEDSRKQARKRFEKERANELWQVDFKGEFRMDSGNCYPLSILDDHSRFGLGLFALFDRSLEGASRGLISTFEKYGVPEGMLMDHGSPWWSTTNGYGLTKLSVSLMKQGIKLYYSGIGHPQTQGKVERFHRTLGEAVKHKGKPGHHLSDWDRVFNEFLHEYNYIRPHEALGMDVPVSRYTPSTRPYNPSPKEWEYPDGSIVTTLNSAGCINWRGKRYFVCEALSGERVRVEVVDDLLLVSYRHMYVREIDTRSGKTHAVVLPI